jgi:hypothetical protein
MRAYPHRLEVELAAGPSQAVAPSLRTWNRVTVVIELVTGASY